MKFNNDCTVMKSIFVTQTASTCQYWRPIKPTFTIYCAVKMGTFRIPVFPRRHTSKIIRAGNVLIKDTWTTSHPHLVIKFAFDCWVWAWLVLNLNRQLYSKLMWTNESEVSLLTAAHKAISLLRGVPVYSTTLINFDTAIHQWQVLLKIIQPLHLWGGQTVRLVGV